MKEVLRRWVGGWLAYFLGMTLAAAQSEDLARRYLQSADLFSERGDYEQALRDWRTVVERFPDSPYAPQAWIAIGRHLLERRADPDSALEAFRTVLQRYPTSPQAAAAQYFVGYIQLHYGRSFPADVSEAVANLERMAVLYPTSEWTGRALTEVGLYLGATGRPGRARHLCRTVVERYPGPAAAEAAFCIAQAYAYEGRWDEALRWLTTLLPTGAPAPLASKIRAAATTLYRQAFRGSTGSGPYGVDPRFQASQQIRWDDPIRLLGWSRGWAVVDRGLKWVIFYDTAGRYVDRQAFSKLDDAFIAPDDRLYVLAGDRVVLPQGRPVSLVGATEGRRSRSIEPTTIVVDRRQTLWAYADDPSGLWVFGTRLEDLKNPASVGAALTSERRLTLTLDGKPLRVFRMYLDGWQRFWVIDRDQTRVLAYARDGSLIQRLENPQRPFQQVLALGWDVCGLLYVLDGKAQTVFIFTPAGQLHRTLALRAFLPEGKLQDMWVADDGSLYLLDRKARRVIRLV
jgi:tetratricopeptide (TPR) repeat protein